MVYEWFISENYNLPHYQNYSFLEPHSSSEQENYNGHNEWKEKE
jgi:hypothetical protein